MARSAALMLTGLAICASGHRIGSGHTVFAKFAPAHGAGAGRKAAAQGSASRRTVVEVEAGPGAAFAVEVSDSEVDHSVASAPYMAANGHVYGREGTEFMIKGTGGALYGWLTLDDEGRAFEYTTDRDGDVHVEEVAVEKVKPTCGDGREHHDHDHGNHQSSAARDAGALAADDGAYTGQDLRGLQSQPGAPSVLLLDIDVYFRSKAEDDSVVHFDKQHFYDTWQTVAGGFSAFNLNVVTDHAVYEQTPVRNRGKACFVNEEGVSKAWYHSFGANRCGSVNYRQKTGYGQGRIALHEVAHQFGLLHDGAAAQAYADGSAAHKWVPVMGNVWSGDKWGEDALYQWSKGEYNGATQQQDDLQQIAQYVARRGDDIVGARALSVAGDGEVRVAGNKGMITDEADSDSWTFTVGAEGGRLDLVIDRTQYVGGAMLDVDATLVDSLGNVVAHSNPKADRRAFIDEAVAGGEYVLVIRGGAEGTPSDGFSSYGSIGNYGISGKVITGTQTDVPAPLTTSLDAVTDARTGVPTPATAAPAGDEEGEAGGSGGKMIVVLAGVGVVVLVAVGVLVYCACSRCGAASEDNVATDVETGKPVDDAPQQQVVNEPYLDDEKLTNSGKPVDDVPQQQVVNEPYLDDEKLTNSGKPVDDAPQQQVVVGLHSDEENFANPAPDSAV